jgi:hypothetical protein
VNTERQPTPQPKKIPMTFIINGHRFTSYEEATAYATANGWRITNTLTIKKHTYLLEIQ